MTDPYIIKDAKPAWGKGKVTAAIAGVAVVGALAVAGTAFGLQQIGEEDSHGVVANEDDSFGGAQFGEDSEDHDDRGQRGEDEGFETEDDR